MATIVFKGSLGFLILQIGNFFRVSSTIPNSYPTFGKDEDTSVNLDFLQPPTLSGMFERMGQAMLLDAALDASKILAILAGKGFHSLHVEYSRRKLKTTVAEIEEALAQKPDNKKKNARKEKEYFEKLKVKRDKIHGELGKKTSLFKIEFDPRLFSFTNLAFEILILSYLLCTSIEALNQFLDPDPASLKLFNSIVSDFDDYRIQNTSQFTLLNYLLSSKIAIIIAVAQIYLNHADMRKQIRTSNLLGNIPIIGIINSLGFKYISLTALYKETKRAHFTSNWAKLFAKGVKDLDPNPAKYLSRKDLIVTDTSKIPSIYHIYFFKQFYENEMSLHGNHGKAIATAEKQSLAKIMTMAQELQEVSQIKQYFYFLANCINIYGNYKFYMNILHIIDNILDLMDERHIHADKIANQINKIEASSVHLKSIKNDHQPAATERPSDATKTKSAAVEPKSDLKETTSAAQNPTSVMPESKTPLIKPLSFQHTNKLFPEKPIRENAKIKTKGQPSESFISASDQSNVAAKMPHHSLAISKLNRDEMEKACKRDAILSCYPLCNRSLLKTILKPDKNVHLVIDEQDIIKLADDLELNHRKTESGHLIKVYRQFGATFHSIHGRDGAGTVNRFFISDFAKALHEVGITIEKLEEIDAEIAKSKTCGMDTLNMLAYVLTERPKKSKKFL